MYTKRPGAIAGAFVASINVPSVAVGGNRVSRGQSPTAHQRPHLSFLLSTGLLSHGAQRRALRLVVLLLVFFLEIAEVLIEILVELIVEVVEIVVEVVLVLVV